MFLQVLLIIFGWKSLHSSQWFTSYFRNNLCWPNVFMRFSTFSILFSKRRKNSLLCAHHAAALWISYIKIGQEICTVSVNNKKKNQKSLFQILFNPYLQKTRLSSSLLVSECASVYLLYILQTTQASIVNSLLIPYPSILLHRASNYSFVIQFMVFLHRTCWKLRSKFHS